MDNVPISAFPVSTEMDGTRENPSQGECIDAAIELCDTTVEPTTIYVTHNDKDVTANCCTYAGGEESSDTASWDSETPLISKQNWDENLDPDRYDGQTWNNNTFATESEETTINNTKETTDTTASMDIACSSELGNTSVNVAAISQLKKVGDIQNARTDAHESQNMSFSGSITPLLKSKGAINQPDEGVLEMDVEEIKFTPLHIIGSGWEFGSLSSINRHSRDGFRSRVNTIDTFPKDGINNNRLLTRVFANTVGSNEIAKPKNELNASFINWEHEAETVGRTSQNRRNLKNIVVISIGLALMFTAIGGLRNLQSSMNAKGGVGVLSLAITYLMFMIGSLVSPFIVKRFKPNTCLVAACLCSSLYVISNYIPIFSVIIPTSALMGFATAVIWNALSTYITELSMLEAVSKNKNTDVVTSRYFGIFFFAFQFSNVVGNLISSVILVDDNNLSPNNTRDASTAGPDITKYFNGAKDNYSNTSSIVTVGVNSTTMSVTCGANYCLNDEPITSASVDDLDKLFLLGTYTTCVLIAVLIMHFFLDELPEYVPSSADVREVIRQAGSVLAMVVDRKFALIVMMCAYTMIGNGFVIADVVKAYVTCPTAIHMVGYTMICFGLFGAASSFISGKMVKCVGRVPIFVTDW